MMFQKKNAQVWNLIQPWDRLDLHSHLVLASIALGSGFSIVLGAYHQKR
jgi:hypothetical protein